MESKLEPSWGWFIDIESLEQNQQTYTDCKQKFTQNISRNLTYNDSHYDIHNLQHSNSNCTKMQSVAYKVLHIITTGIKVGIVVCIILWVD
jgi:hypothetical protein